MSRQDDGFGRKAGPNPGSESDFTNRPSVSGTRNAQSWGTNALNAQPSEVGLMTQGAGRPGWPATGQRPMFGGGSPVFAQMPSYTPVTRGTDPRPQMPEPPQPAYAPYTAQPPQPLHAHPSQHAASGMSYSNPQAPGPMNYPSPEPAPSYQSPEPGYQSAHHASGPGYASAPNYQAADFGGQSYQPFQPASFRDAEHPGSQPYSASGYDVNQDFQSQSYRDQGFADASFPESSTGDASYPDASYPETGYDQNFGDTSFTKPGFADAGFSQQQQHGFDASFPDQVFPGAQPASHQDPHGSDAYGGHDGNSDQGFEPFADEAAPNYGEQVPKSDPRRQLQAFDAIYDQPPQIALGSTEPARRPAQDYYENERLDADFLDGAQLPPPGTPAKGKLTLRSRSAFMVGSALLGAIALGGALAFAYKQSGGGLGSEPPPLVQADDTPVKEAPDQPGGKEFAHKNKLIYDRLQNGDAPEAEKIVSRQEDVAVPALPAADPAAMPAPVATTDAVPPTTQAVPGAQPVAMGGEDDASMPDGGPRKVKTMVVRPDGSVESPAVPELPTDAAPAAAPPAETAATPAMPAADPQLAAVSPAPPAAEPQPAQPAPQEAAAPAEPAPKAKPKPAAKPAAQQTAAAAPQAAAAPSKYVVQVGSKKNQTEALASFADMQQKYPTLLASYRPIVQKADLGSKGTWYRLRIGPITDKTAANKLCSQLKSQGLPDCLVMAQ
jgi:SPOR domain